MEGILPKAKKSLGQNFLQDANIAKKIVRALNISHNDSVVEIGPGPGALTGVIQACSPARLVLIEKDSRFARERMRENRTGPGFFSVILADALTIPWERFTEPWKCIGNLPYNVASPLMWEIFSRARGFERVVFMVQKEVGLRITARPDSSAYGALSVWVQSFVRPKLEFIVPPQVFRPRPKVDSSVLSFEPLEKNGQGQNAVFGGGGFSPECLSRTLKICFQMRRKQLGSILRAHGINLNVLEDLGIDPQLRPENLPPTSFHRLSRAMFFTRND